MDIVRQCHSLLCLCVLEGPSHSVFDSFGSKVSLSDGVARWDESLMFPFDPSSSTPVVSPGFCRMFPGFHPCFCIRSFSLLLCLSAWIRSALSVGGRRSLHLFCVFLSFSRPGLLVAFNLPVELNFIIKAKEI